MDTENDVSKPSEALLKFQSVSWARTLFSMALITKVLLILADITNNYKSSICQAYVSTNLVRLNQFLSFSQEKNWVNKILVTALRLFQLMTFEHLSALSLTNSEGCTFTFQEGVMPVLSVCGPRLHSLILSNFPGVDIAGINTSPFTV